MLRSVLAVVTGFLFIAIFSFGADALVRALLPGAFDPAGGAASAPILILTLLYVAVFAIAGCYLTARLAPHRPLGHALVLGALGLIFTTLGTIVAWDTAPAWYHVLSLALVMPYAYVGGRLRERELLRDSGRTALATG